MLDGGGATKPDLGVFPLTFLDFFCPPTFSSLLFFSLIHRRKWMCGEALQKCLLLQKFDWWISLWLLSRMGWTELWHQSVSPHVLLCSLCHSSLSTLFSVDRSPSSFVSLYLWYLSTHSHTRMTHSAARVSSLCTWYSGGIYTPHRVS